MQTPVHGLGVWLLFPWLRGEGIVDGLSASAEKAARTDGFPMQMGPSTI